MHPDVETIIMDRLREGLRNGTLTAIDQQELDALIGNVEVIVGKVALRLETVEALIQERGLSEEFETMHRLAKQKFIKRSHGYE
ncbi:hypothetical protein [Gorillibacterium timonense]|uniref:hypothetical protein n=1 Tax=Gorillibacterium timonense TaxID=1689269 RepID=UPI0011DD02CC|nr:hypothetical protein [Gorillibacterium timonense]